MYVSHYSRRFYKYTPLQTPPSRAMRFAMELICILKFIGLYNLKFKCIYT